MKDVGRVVIPILVLGMIAVVAASPVIGFDQRPRLIAVDGDTVDSGGERWRLRYIDAPEMGRSSSTAAGRSTKTSACRSPGLRT